MASRAEPAVRQASRLLFDVAACMGAAGFSLSRNGRARPVGGRCEGDTTAQQEGCVSNLVMQNG
jgi:hypothetical protein